MRTLISTAFISLDGVVDDLVSNWGPTTILRSLDESGR